VSGMKKLVTGLAVAALLALPARPTWSVVVVNTRTGEMGVAGATCLGYVELKDELTVVYNGVGVAAAQSAVDSSGTNRQIIWDGFMQGLSPQEILDRLAASDPNHYSRQYGIVDLEHDPVTFSGSGCGEAAAGVVGIVGDLRYAIQGNVLTGDAVVLEAEKALLATQGDLSQRILAAMEAARSMGGDGRCSCSFGNPVGCGAPPPSFTRSAIVSFFVLTRRGDRPGVCNGTVGCANGSYYLDLNWTKGWSGPDPVLKLERMYKAWRVSQQGRPDQVRSLVRVGDDKLVANGLDATRVELELLDIEGAPVNGPGPSVWLTQAGTTGPFTAPSALTHLGGNRWGFALRAGTTAGVDRWRVWVDDGQGAVLLQPDVVVEVVP